MRAKVCFVLEDTQDHVALLDFYVLMFSISLRFHSSEPCFWLQHIVDSMKNPSIAEFWLITLPQVVGGFEYDDEVKRKIWWQYKVHFCLHYYFIVTLGVDF